MPNWPKTTTVSVVFQRKRALSRYVSRETSRALRMATVSSGRRGVASRRLNSNSWPSGGLKDWLGPSPFPWGIRRVPPGAMRLARRARAFGSGAKALAVTTSKLPRSDGCSSRASTLALRQEIPSSSSRRIAWMRKEALRLDASIRVTRRPGLATFRGIPGKPAPLPTSASASRSPSGKKGRRRRERRIPSLTIRSGSLNPVRFIRRVQRATSAA